MPSSITTEFTDVAVLRGMRDVLGMSQEGFANLIGMKRQQLSGYERQHHSPAMNTVVGMAERAGVRLRVTIEPIEGNDSGVDPGASTSIEVQRRIHSDERFPTPP